MKKISILLTGLAFSVGFGQNLSTVRDVVGSAIPNVVVQPDGADEDCAQETLSNAFENGHGNLHLLTVANDFTVEAGETFAVDQFTFNVILPAGMSVSAADIYFYEDTGSGPGTELEYIEFTTPASETSVGTLGAFDVKEVTFTFDPVLLNGGGSATTFWVGTMIFTDAANSYWEGTSVVDTENEGYLFLDGSWQPISSVFGSAPFDGVFEVSGDCSIMGVSDVNAGALSVYPNPASDVINVSLKNADVKAVSLTNLSGQTVVTTKNSTVNVSALPAGVYLLNVVDSKGATHTSKVVVK